MKKIFKIIALFLFALNCKAQAVVNVTTLNQDDNSNKYFKDIDNFYQNFTGTWENTSGNITFRLIIWKEANAILYNGENSKIDMLNAKYVILENAGTPLQRVLYNSIRYFKNNGYTSNNVMIAWAINGSAFSGFFTDTRANGGSGVLNAAFSFEILNQGTTPVQAQWEVESAGPMYDGDYFSVPTDVILTKVN